MGRNLVEDLFSNEGNLVLKEYPGLCKVCHGERLVESIEIAAVQELFMLVSTSQEDLSAI
uniref:Uncharacterized protein n=1 Tax=Salix viminalis TaxID=40686 RepID=A0A6N2KA93_SALVM